METGLVSVGGRIFDDLHSRLPVPVKRAESNHYILAGTNTGGWHADSLHRNGKVAETS